MRRTPLRAKQWTPSALPTNPHGPPGVMGGALRILNNATDRSVHVKIRPRPRSLGESIQVLHELRRYGEIEVFRHLKHDPDSPGPNSLFVVFKEAASASAALKDTSLAFRYSSELENVQKNASAGTAGLGRSTKQEESPQTHIDPYPRPGELVMQKATLQHLPLIQRQYYYWPVETCGEGNPGEAILGKLPESLKGLSDFDITKGENTMRDRKGITAEKEREVYEKGWRTLNELWELGKADRLNAAVEVGSVESKPR